MAGSCDSAYTGVRSFQRREKHMDIDLLACVFRHSSASSQLLGIRSLSNPALAGLSILALAGVVRQLWPREKSLPLIGSLDSGNFLSVPAHVNDRVFHARATFV